MAACVFGEAGGGERREHHGPRLLGGQCRPKWSRRQPLPARIDLVCWHRDHPLAARVAHKRQGILRLDLQPSHGMSPEEATMVLAVKGGSGAAHAAA